MKTMTYTEQPASLREYLGGDVRDRGRLYRAAVPAYAYVLLLQGQPSTQQEDMLSHMTIERAQRLDLDQDADLQVAILIGAVDEVRKAAEGATFTAAETLQMVLNHLDDYYSADY